MWRFIDESPGNDWATNNYDDRSWQNVSMSIQPKTVSGNTQYFRHSFNNSVQMAAYELCLLYQFGIVIYISGVEVIRDNMPNG